MQKILVLIYFTFYVFTPINIFAQDEPWEVIPTDCNMSVALLGDLEITFNGEVVSDPIWLGVTNADGFVSGMILHTPGETSGLTVWGDDASTGEYDGMLAGEEFNWIVSYYGLEGGADLDVSIEYSCNGLLPVSEAILVAESDESLTDLLTYVPDDGFEQYLIDSGYDDILDDYVLTNNINSILYL